ncbi:hypothetical protein GCM10027169_27070 [Gordonia jinhuaensis]|uniref:Transmembrane protein n=1 Tax=Gordonia jinhuaensis TaxID=1517702 RepID=A0A916WWE1_9ACTN|nr:DUF2537 domain-containing protein [Gordonia jinhuaensis]GGB37786.1 hypothetical protein GCM10011489_26940 [Gordonia jinhuaensis]
MTTEHADAPWCLGGIVCAAVFVFWGLLSVCMYSVVAEINPILGLTAVIIVEAGLVPPVFARRRQPVWRFVAPGMLAAAIVAICASVVVMIVG